MAALLENDSTFAGHRIERLLAAGGMAEVYRAIEIRSGQTVALKLISPQVAGDERFRRRFERESRIARDLDHPHLVTVRGAGEHDGRLYLSMDFVEGLDLSAVLVLRGRLHPRHAATIVSQVAQALDTAAERGLVHRDVKPGNIFLAAGDQPHAHLGDFGLTKHVSSTSGLTRTGNWVGTIDYASPEQLQADEVDRRTDVYALGAVLHRTLTGKVPYERDREIDTMMAQLSEPPPRPSKVAEAIPVDFDDVVATAMAKAPDARYPTAGELGRSALRAAEGASAPPPWTISSDAGGKPTGGPDAPTAA